MRRTENLPILVSPGSNFCRLPEPRVRDGTVHRLILVLELVSGVIDDAEHRRWQTLHQLRLGEPLRLPNPWNQRTVKVGRDLQEQPVQPRPCH